MFESFKVTGVNPATGELVSLAVRAETEMDAKAHAESCGLMYVTVKAGPAPTPVRTAVPYWLEGMATAPRW